MEDKTKQEKCLFCHPFMGPNYDEHHCCINGFDDDKTKAVTINDCEQCQQFKSRYIEYPITVNKIEYDDIKPYGFGHEIGCVCEVKPCDKKFNGKTYIGFYLGELPINLYASYDTKTSILQHKALTNPAIFVPELKKIIYGCESWWREIKSPEAFKGITDNEIENTWYVKLINALYTNKTEEDS